MSPTTHLVVWGLRHKYDTYRYIHAGFAAAARRLGWQVDWVEDSQSNQSVVTPKSLVIGVNLCQQHLPLVTGARYVIHNNERADLASAITNGAGINLQTWTFNCPGEAIDGRQAIRYNAATRTLFQPWGTPVSPSQWSAPQISGGRFVFWIGSVWNNKLNQGNRIEINKLAKALRERGYLFVHPWPRIVSQPLHKRLIQISGLRPAVCGKWQADNGYIPCRAFKNLSFGALPITNNQAVNVALGESVPCHSSMQELVEGYLNMTADDILARTQQAQSHLGAFTYESNLKRFAKLTGGVG